MKKILATIGIAFVLTLTTLSAVLAHHSYHHHHSYGGNYVYGPWGWAYYSPSTYGHTYQWRNPYYMNYNYNRWYSGYGYYRGYSYGGYWPYSYRVYPNSYYRPYYW